MGGDYWGGCGRRMRRMEVSPSDDLCEAIKARKAARVGYESYDGSKYSVLLQRQDL